MEDIKEAKWIAFKRFDKSRVEDGNIGRATLMLKHVDREVGMVGYKCAVCGAEFVQLDPPTACVLCGRETERVEEMGEGES